jgi:uncharacterized protein YdaU (DUF1376 family)
MPKNRVLERAGMNKGSNQTTTMPYFKFDSGQFLAETMGLPDAMVGMYVRLMALYWEHNCSLPSDEVLRQKLATRTKKGRESLDFIIKQFFSGDQKRHERLDQGMSEIKAMKTRQSSNAKARWEKAGSKELGNTHADSPIDTADF